MKTLREAFAPQLNDTQPITSKRLELMRTNRQNSYWTDEQMESYFKGVLPDVSKELFFMVEEKGEKTAEGQSVRLTILSCWDHELSSMEEAYVVISTENDSLPRLQPKHENLA